MPCHAKQRVCFALLSKSTVFRLNSKQGFEHLVDTLEDIVLDVPAAAQLLALFISRTIVDDVLPPSFLSHISPGADPERIAVTLILTRRLSRL